jgi:hypothetical protein
MFRLLILAVPAAALAGGCARGVDPEALESLRETDGEPIYWAGESVEGHELVHAGEVAGRTDFIYGDCEIETEGWFTDGGCAPPVDIQQWPLRQRHPAQFDIRSCRRLTVRGVPAAIFESSGGALEIYTGSSVVVIFGESRAQQRRIAEELRPINGPEGAGAPLPPPTDDVAAGLADCPRLS